MTGRNIAEERGTLGALLRLPYGHLQRVVYGGLAARGFPDIREAHSAVFRTITPQGARVSDMAERAGMTKQSMAYLVEALAGAGYVTVTADPDDRRAKRVRLTARGEAVWEALIALSAAAEARLAARIGAAKMASLRALLGELAAAIPPPPGPDGGRSAAPAAKP
ncbi:MAG: winged helix DNA-binding protein [Rhodospirillales bacterium]|nr:winged helix DNA-binding protein [Rhodospirillales bacterium]